MYGHVKPKKNVQYKYIFIESLTLQGLYGCHIEFFKMADCPQTQTTPTTLTTPTTTPTTNGDHIGSFRHSQMSQLG